MPLHTMCRLVCVRVCMRACVNGNTHTLRDASTVFGLALEYLQVDAAEREARIILSFHRKRRRRRRGSRGEDDKLKAVAKMNKF